MNRTIEYSIGRYQIRINVWLFIVFLIFQTLLNELGFWQLERAKEKQIRLQQLGLGSKQINDDLTQISEAQLNQFQRVSLTAEVLNEPPIFLDNQTHNKAPGYHVIQVVKDIASNKFVLVNRGWQFSGKDRKQLPEMEPLNTEWQIEGRLYPISAAENVVVRGEVEHLKAGTRIPGLSLSILAELEAKLRIPLEQYIVRLDVNAPNALEVNWKWTNMPVEKHLAYAVQWFGLALTLLIVSLIVAVKRR